VAVVLVTGGTGVLGSRVASRLVGRGHDVRVLSRREAPEVVDGAVAVQGDVRTGDGLADAVAGADVVVHSASNPRWRPRATEVDGTRNLLDAAGGARPHLIYVSIVGVDRIPFSYYRAKLAAEEIVAAGPLPWTIQRATQFHYLPFEFLVAGRGVVPRGARSQLIDSSEVADRLADQAEGEPAGRAPDMGGPEVLSVKDIVRIHHEVTGRRLRVLEVRPVGKSMRGFAEGHNLCPDHAVGTITFEEYLRWRETQG